MAASVVRIVDQTPSGERLHEQTLELRLVREKMTVRELITRRVRAEVRRHNAAPGLVYRGLVQPTEAERVLNGFRFSKPRAIDEEAQVAQAVEAFGRNGFLLFVGDEQVEDLDAEVVLGEEIEVGFVRLVPLIGG